MDLLLFAGRATGVKFLGSSVLSSSSSLFSDDVSSMFFSSSRNIRVSAFVPGFGKCSIGVTKLAIDSYR